jgi:pimeloyl-ACP methyl ester carboxylesterase
VPLLTALALTLGFAVLSCAGNRETEPAAAQDPLEAFLQARRDSLFLYYQNMGPYPPFNVLEFSGGSGYELKNTSSDSLLILLVGSGMRSVMDPGLQGGFLAWFLPFLDSFTIFMPEKFDWQLGALDKHLDLKAREQYTIEARIDNHYEVITEYLSQNNFKTIVIIGASEGGMLLPELYTRLNNHNIKALVSIAGGGLTYYENALVFFEKMLAGDRRFANLSEEEILEWEESFERFFTGFSEEPFNDSPEMFYEGAFMTFRWIASIAHRNIFNYLKTINTPMLFMHGELDLNVLVESTRFVEKNLPNAPCRHSK